MEPALICFQNDSYVSCFLDRNGLRPTRIEYFDDDSVCVSSEVESNKTKNIKCVGTGRLGPGGLILFDRNTKELLMNDEVDKKLSASKPYRNWLKESKTS